MISTEYSTFPAESAGNGPENVPRHILWTIHLGAPRSIPWAMQPPCLTGAAGLYGFDLIRALDPRVVWASSPCIIGRMPMPQSLTRTDFSESVLRGSWADHAACRYYSSPYSSIRLRRVVRLRPSLAARVRWLKPSAMARAMIVRSIRACNCSLAPADSSAVL